MRNSIIINGDKFLIGKSKDCFSLISDGPEEEVSLCSYELTSPVTLREWCLFVYNTEYYPEKNEGYLSYLANPSILDDPVVCISQEDAIAYCEWQKGTLPSPKEIEVAFKHGYRNDLFLWSNENLKEGGLNIAAVCGNNVSWFENNQKHKYPFTSFVGRKHYCRPSKREVNIGFCVRHNAQGLASWWIKECNDYLYEMD